MTRTLIACVVSLSILCLVGCGSGASDVSDDGAVDKYNEINKQTEAAGKEKDPKAETRE